MKTSNHPEIARGGNPYDYIGAQAVCDYSRLARRMLESTPEFLARTYSRQELCDALALQMGSPRVRVAIIRS